MRDRLRVILFSGVGLFLFGLLCYTFGYRVFYPYDLEWMEGGMLIHAQRIVEGKGIYVEPSSDFIPYIYPPLYAWLLALFSSLTTLDYAVGRSLSFVGTVLAGGAILRAIRLEKLGWEYAILGAGLFFSCYEDGGTFFDLTRADGLLIAALGWALVFVREGKLRLGGSLLFLAFLFKHNAAIFGLPCLWWVWKERGVKSALEFSLWSAIPALTMTAYLQWSSDGYFLTYLLQVPSGHPIVGYRLAWLSFEEIFGAFSGLSLLGFAWIAGCLYKDKRWFALGAWSMALGIAGAIFWLPLNRFPEVMGSHRNGVIPFAGVMWIFALIACWRLVLKEPSPYRFWIVNGILALGFSALMRGHHGGFTNVLIPALWFCSIWSVLLLAHLARYSVALALVVGFSAWKGVWDPKSFIPTAEDKNAGDKLVAILESVEGPIFAPHSPWLAVQAGHPPTAHLIAIWDIDHEEGPLHEHMKKIHADISGQRWGGIVWADPRPRFDIRSHYQKDRVIRPSEGLFMPKIGWKVRPSYLWMPTKKKEQKLLER